MNKKIFTSIKEFKSVLENNNWKEIVKISDEDTILHGEATIRDIIDYFEPKLTNNAIISTTNYNELYEYEIYLKTNVIKIIDLKVDRELQNDFAFKPAFDITTEDLKGIHKKLASKQNILVEYINESNDEEEEELDMNDINALQSELRRLNRWKYQYDSTGQDGTIKKLEDRIEYLKSVK